MAGIGSIEQDVREAIIRGTFAPASRLRMEELKARFDVGFSPIREALSRLIGEGLVELEPNRGFRVAPLSKEDLEDIAVSRIAVETAALRRSIELGDDRWEAAVVGAMHRYRRNAQDPFAGGASLLAWEAAHDDLHGALIGACGSPRLLMMQRRLQDQHLRYRRLVVVPEVSGDVHVEEHEKIVALALDRDADAATAEIERHMRITVDALTNARFWESKGPARTR
jgi:DNA-binding GntR family transcriptional regulator